MTKNSQALQPYGEKEELRTLANRVIALLPGGSKLTKNEALALAQLALAYGLNPFNGEVFPIPGKGSMVGIKGLRKAARKQGFFQTRPRNMTVGERDERQLKDDDVGRMCELYRWGEGVPVDQNLPFWGEGIAYANETPPRTKSKVWLADKRAEADALKKAYDLPFGYYEQLNGGLPTVAIVGDQAAQLEAMVLAEEGHAPLREPERTAPEAAAELYGDWDSQPTTTAAPTWGMALAKVNTERWEKACEHVFGQTEFYDPSRQSDVLTTEDMVSQMTGNAITAEAKMLEAALNLGFPVINDKNIEECVTALIEYAKEELAQSTDGEDTKEELIQEEKGDADGD